MRRLFRFAMTLFTLGLAMIGCNRSSSPGTADDQGAGDAPFKAVFRVPGMS